MTTAERIAQLKRLIGETHKHGVKLNEEIASLRRRKPRGWVRQVALKRALEAGLKALNFKRHVELARLEHKPAPKPPVPPKPAPKPAARFTMYDAVEIRAIPDDPEAVAGYVDWTYDEVVQRFPRAKHLSISKDATVDADCLDVETGDATPAQAPSWVRKQHARGEKTPWVYVEASRLGEVIDALTKDDIKRDEYRIWVADWTGEPHIPDGADACQWRGEVGVPPMVYDESLCEGYLL